ncbi:YD repeat (two copies) [compost metagenome]
MGNRTSRKVGTAAADTFAYDAMDRLVRAAYPGGQVFTFSYDLAGRLLSQTSYQGNTWNYTYDAHDLPTSETLVLKSPARTYSFRYTYNALDRLQSITYPSGLAVDHAPDAYGRATRAGSFASALAYHPDGQLSSLTYGNGRKLTVAQDSRRLRVTERQVGGPDMPMRLR